MQVAGVHDFAYTKDLYGPQKNRLKIHLSALINLTLYRLNKLAAFSEKAQEAVCTRKREEGRGRREEGGRRGRGDRRGVHKQPCKLS
jgi:Nuf2 family